MPFWEQSAPALADWECAGEAISLNENRLAMNEEEPSWKRDDDGHRLLARDALVKAPFVP